MSKSVNEVDPRVRTTLQERYRVIDGPTLRRMIEASVDWLRTNQHVVNALNVFPVPDGDTGTNMVLTMQAAMDEMGEQVDKSVGRVAHAVAHGALMGARGNSGVILSQLWRGFARTLDEYERMDATLMAQALDEARETAYKGVVRPVEGTILTVSKDIAKEAQAAVQNGASSAFELLELIVEAADISVENTPELLPVLKDAGVVDSGGKGLFFILEGMVRAAYQQPLDEPILSVQPLSAINLEGATEAIEPGQDWEVIVDFHPKDQLDLKTFYNDLEEMGTSIQVGEGDGLYRMHIHVPDTTEYKPIDYIRELGTISNVAIENLMLQVSPESGSKDIKDLSLQPIEPGQNAVIAVAPGLGLARVFASLGVTGIIEGGQTMNPSTQEILNSFEDLPTDKVILLPNNKNIVLAANQASELTVKDVAVIPCVSVPQGIAAMFSWEPGGDFASVADNMKRAIDDVHSAEITTATRSAEIDGVTCEAGQVIGLLNGQLACSGDKLEQVLMETLELAEAESRELITLYYGGDLSSMDANQLGDRIREKYSDQELEIHEGGQPHYQLILSIE